MTNEISTKTNITNSKRFAINYKDLLHGFFITFAAAIIGLILPIINNGQFPDFSLASLQTMLQFGLTAGLSYLLKKFVSDADNKIIPKKETIED